MQLTAFVLGLVLTCAHSVPTDKTLVYSWVAVEYDWPNDTLKQDYITAGKFIVENNVICGIKDNRAVLKPFPSWAHQTEGDCRALQYVQSMEVDPNTGLMWIIDNGRVDIMDDGGARNLCPPKLVIYDLKRNAQTHSYTFPTEVADPTSCFLNDVVLHYVGGQVKYAYITDTRDAKLYVYNHEDNTSHFFQDPSMRTDNGSGSPIDGIAMSADFDYVYYCPIDGLGLFQVPTSILSDPQADFHRHVRRVGTRRSRSDGLAYGQDSLFYGLIDLNSVERWRVSVDADDGDYSDVTMTTREELAHDDVSMAWVDTLAWDESGYLWFTANDLSRYFSRTMDFTGASGTNFHVWKVFVNESSYLSPHGNKDRPSDAIIG